MGASPTRPVGTPTVNCIALRLWVDILSCPPWMWGQLYFKIPSYDASLIGRLERSEYEKECAVFTTVLQQHTRWWIVLTELTRVASIAIILVLWVKFSVGWGLLCGLLGYIVFRLEMLLVNKTAADAMERIGIMCATLTTKFSGVGVSFKMPVSVFVCLCE
jgi:hypothetical protein